MKKRGKKRDHKKIISEKCDENAKDIIPDLKTADNMNLKSDSFDEGRWGSVCQKHHFSKTHGKRNFS